MNKLAIIQADPSDNYDKSPSPCEQCGHPAVTVHNGTPLCRTHASVNPQKVAEFRIEAIDKVAADLNLSK